MKFVIPFLKTAFIVFVLICICLHFLQEKLIFFPQKLPANYTFHFNQPFDELTFRTADNKLLNGLLFKSDSTKGLIFYLHGNAGSLETWGQLAKTYTSLQYDLFMPDYRGYGKSEGRISSEKQLYEDVQLMYDSLKKNYPEGKIVVLGYSIGTGPAAKLASTNNPRVLILQAPYFSLTDMMKHNFPLVPVFLLKYKFETNRFIKCCSMPVVIFHGTLDEVIYFGSSLQLQKLFKPADTLIGLDGQGHNGMTDNPTYLLSLQAILK